VPDKGSLIVLVDGRDPAHKSLVVASQLRLTSRRATSQQVLGRLHAAQAKQRSRAADLGRKINNTLVGRAVVRPGRRKNGRLRGSRQKAALNISQMLNRRTSMRSGASQCDKNAGCAGSAEDVLPDCRFAGKRTVRYERGREGVPSAKAARAAADCLPKRMGRS
jgi:hypothetical protein